MSMIAARLASALPSFRLFHASQSLRQGLFGSGATPPTQLDLQSTPARMSLLSKFRPLATYTNATTEVIDPPEGGKVSRITTAQTKTLFYASCY